MNSQHITIRFIAVFLSLIFLAQCSSDQAAIPEVGQNFCTDLDGDTYAGFYTRDETDTADAIRALTLVTCTTPYDCNDDPSDSTATSIFPGAVEIADNGIDEDCDAADFSTGIETGEVEETTTTTTTACSDGSAETTYYQDLDGDGYGTSTVTQMACSRPSGYSTLSTDCADSNSDVHPGATESLGDENDQDCDGGIDTMVCDVSQTYFLDADGDGYRGTESVTSCFRPASNYFLATEAESEDSCATGADSNKYQNPGMSGKDYGYLVYQTVPSTMAYVNLQTTPIITTFTSPTNTNAVTMPAITTIITNTPFVNIFGYESTSTNELGLPEPTDREGVVTQYFYDVDNDCDGDTDEDGNKSADNAYVINEYLPDENYNTTHGVYFNRCDGDGAFKYYADADGDGYGANDSESFYECRKSDSAGYAFNNTDCDDTLNRVYPDSGDDYSNMNGNTYDYSGIDSDCDGETDENGYLDSSTSFDASVAWNGLYLTSDDSTNFNTEHIAIGSYVSDIDVNSATGAVSYKGKTIYKHGIGNDDKFSYEIYHTPMRSNRIFMQMYENYFYFTNNSTSGNLEGGDQTAEETNFSISCNDTNQCSGSFIIDLSKSDSRGDSFEGGTSFLKGKVATIHLRGFSFEHASQKHFGDNSIDISLDEADITSDSKVKVHFAINFNGNDADSMSGHVFFTISVHDPDYIKISELPHSASTSNSNLVSNTISEDGNDGSHLDKLAYSEEATPNLSASTESYSCYFDYCVDKTIAAGIVLNNWGFDNPDGSFAIDIIEAYARPWEFQFDNPRFAARYEGWAFHRGGSNTSAIPNNLKASVISCANTSVCQFLHRDTEKSGIQESDQIEKEAF